MLRFIRTLAVVGVATVVLGGASQLHADSVVFVRGDANGNGVVEPHDWTALMSYLTTGKAVKTLEALDVDDNGRIDERDFIGLQRLLERPRPPMPLAIRFLRGDVNGNQVVDLGDVNALFAYLYAGTMIPVGAKAMDAADVNHDLRIDLADVLALVRRLTPPSQPATT